MSLATRRWFRRLGAIMGMWLRAPSCKLCGAATTLRVAHGRPFAECGTCGFIFTNDYDETEVSRGMGMEGSWSGPGGGGFREYYLARLLADELGLKKILLFGTGNTTTLESLLKEGYDVVGADISAKVVESKKKRHGDDRFHLPHEIPADAAYDAIVAVEVFEHFSNPGSSFDFLVKHCRPGGVIAGTTNLYPGTGPIDDGNHPAYMSVAGHVAYWSSRSMSALAGRYDRKVALFELVCPGSVKPDEKYNQLYPNKRVFFIHPPAHEAFFLRLKEAQPILPIDRP